MATRRVSFRGGGLIAILALIVLSLAQKAFAAELLTNGGFEQGLSGWTGGVTRQECPGAAALLTSASEPIALLQQTVKPIAAGSYVLSGQAKVVSGSPAGTASLLWRDGSGSTISQTPPAPLPTSSGYSSFTLSDPASPAGAQSLVVQIRVNASGDATVCVDDLSLDGPAAPAATATAAPSATPSPTASATAAPATATASAQPPPTATSTATTAPLATSTRPPVTPTPRPSAIRTVEPQASGQFVNGGFEDGLASWQKYGGELQVVSEPRRSGSLAAAFVSRTTATKWAFQLVAIDPSQSYEFSGYLLSDAGAEAAYLRVSWYESADGSGRAIATDDSPEKLSGASEGYVYLTTGALQPPPKARSARLRAMLAPRGGGPATLYLDDFSFGPAPPGAATPRPSSRVAAADEPDEAPPARGASTPASSGTRPATSATALAEVASSSAEASADTEEGRGGGVSPLWLGAGLLFLLGLAGGYVYARRRSP